MKKRPCVPRSHQPTPTGPEEQWGMDFFSDSLESGRHIRTLTILDLWDRSTPALEVDISLSGQRVVQVLERLRLQGRLPRGFLRTMTRSSQAPPWMQGRKNTVLA